LIIVRST